MLECNHLDSLIFRIRRQSAIPMKNCTPHRDKSERKMSLVLTRPRNLPVRARLGAYLAMIVLALLLVQFVAAQPVAAQAVGPVYALPGTLTHAVNRSYDSILTVANGTQYGVAGQTPEIEAQIVQFRAQGEAFEVKVWGDRYPAASETDLELIIVSNIQQAVPPTPEITTTATATPPPTATPTDFPTPMRTAEPTPAVPIAVISVENVNMRSGPGTEYVRVGGLVAGQVCAITGRNQASTWWRLSCPLVNGWVFGDLLTLAGPVTGVPVIQTAPPPTPVPPATFNNWKSSFFNNRDLSGEPVLVVDQPKIDFNWGGGSPGTGVSSENFSARFERTLNFTYGNYELVLTMDDGARVYVDDQLVINDWNVGGGRTRTAQLVLSGEKRLRVEYFEAGGTARIQFAINLVSSSEAWIATYYKGKGFGSAPVLTRGEPRSNSSQLDYNWGRGSPASVVPVDIFSARWEGTFNFEGGDYRFNAISDDGIRVYLDGILVLDRWLNGYQDDVTNTFRSLGAGNHQIVVEYYEAHGDALVRVWWERE